MTVNLSRKTMGFAGAMLSDEVHIGPRIVPEAERVASYVDADVRARETPASNKASDLPKKFGKGVYLRMKLAILLVTMSLIVSIVAVVAENRIIGVSGAVLMVLGLLTAVSWMEAADVQQRPTEGS